MADDEQSMESEWKEKFEEETFPDAVDQGGESLGVIYYRWFFTGNASYALKHPKGIPTTNTKPVRRLFEEEKVRYPNEFFYSCDQNDLEVDFGNPLSPPTMGPLFPADYLLPPNTSGSHGSTGKPQSSASFQV